MWQRGTKVTVQVFQQRPVKRGYTVNHPIARFVRALEDTTMADLFDHYPPDAGFRFIITPRKSHGPS